MLGIDEHGDMRFAYNQDWVGDARRPALSFSLPKRGGPFSRRESRPFFAGLLPEQEQRTGAARALGISRENDFGLLERLGGDVAGALTLWPAGEEPPLYEAHLTMESLTAGQLVRVLDSLPMRPLLAGEHGVRLSLAGAQQKLPVVLVEGEIALPAPGQPTTHILKPPVASLPNTTENEAFAMRLAQAVGLDVAPVEPRRVLDRPFLLVTRYDRASENDGRVARIHQEDFCQALGISPEHKYAGEGGPGLRQCFDLVRDACARPAPSTLKLIDAVIFNAIIGNADAHGKNFSLVYRPDGCALAPLYDLMVTAAYPEIAANFAMRIGDRSRIEEFREDTWAVFARDVGVTWPYVRRRVQQLAQAIDQRAHPVASRIAEQGFDAEALSSFATIVRERASAMTNIITKNKTTGTGSL